MSDQDLSATLPQIIAELARPLAESLNLSLWGIEFAFSGRGIVRVYVEGGQDVDGGNAVTPVTIDECAELSRLLGLALDVEDAIPGAYVLEVSSPGLERIFFTAEQLAGALGQTLEVTLLTPPLEFSGRRKFRGLLTAAPENKAAGKFTLQVDNPSRPGEREGELSFAFTDLKKVRQLHIVPEKIPPGKNGKKKSNIPGAPIPARNDSEDSHEPGTEKSH